MGTVEQMPKSPICSICHKRKAEYLCDMPKGKIKSLHLKKPNGVTDYENSFKWNTITCDRAICSKCAIEIGNDIHFCKVCARELKGKLN